MCTSLVSRLLGVALALTACATPASAQDPRLLRPDDLFNLKTVGDPRISPDGQWVAFTVRSMNRTEDATDTDIYMVPIAGGDPVRLTTSPKPERSPRWSPDGRYLAFLSSRDDKHTQVWVLDRQGGEAVKLTSYKADVSSVVWSPDGSRLALLVSDVDPDETQDEPGDGKKPPTAKPIVITRLQFKRDGVGYLREERTHVHVFDVKAKTSVQVTSGTYDDEGPAWSPDGMWIAFSSNRTAAPDANRNTDIFVTAAAGGGAPRALTTSPGEDEQPQFTADGRSVVYVAGGDPKDMWYAPNSLAVVPAAGGASKSLTATLDRNIARPKIAPNGDVYFVLEDGGSRHLAKVNVTGGTAERVMAGPRVIEAFDLGPADRLVVLQSQPTQPYEIFAIANQSATQITHVNDAFLKGIRLATVERFKATSTDGATIDGFLTRPPQSPTGTRLPAVLRIHGGPASQFENEFDFEWQVLAAHGYAVIAANPRGSTGYGRDFSRAIWADWGVKDYQDVMAAVDHVVSMGVADPARLGVGGWSYGGILTNYVITKTTRFKAAISGASEVNFLSNYGTDHYQYEWETELGLPWKNVDRWVKMSPFFSVEQITTPTLIMCGEDDMNVPLLNSEQLYQALRRLGKETQLVVYPGQHHGIAVPSYQVDRFDRYLAWYDKYLGGTPTATP